jgi:quercetin dioxygenase-like cupin family protein
MGKYALFEAIISPGGRPPTHVHSREEGFYILEGEIPFTIGEQRMVARARLFGNMPVPGWKALAKKEAST